MTLDTRQPPAFDDEPSQPSDGRAGLDPPPGLSPFDEVERSVPALPRIDLVAIDLDGTLLTDTKQVSTRAVGALFLARRRGVRIVIASARPPRSVRAVYQALKLDTWQINYNGALVWDEPNRKAVFHDPMDCGLTRMMINHARDLYPEVLVSCEILDRWYTDRADQPYVTETGRLFRPNVVAPLDAFCVEPITKLLLLGPAEMMGTLATLFRAAYPTVTVIHSEKELLQITHHRVSKASALTLVAHAYGVPMARVMAIGDAANDIPMLQVAGVAVAMDNAPPSVKNVADWVAPSNNDHGVHAALKRFGLCE